MIEEIKTKREVIKTIIPKQTYKPIKLLQTGYKTITNLEIIDKIIYKLEKAKKEYILTFEDNFLKIMLEDKHFKVKLWGA